MQYLLIIIFLISTSALILAILAFTRKNGEKYLVPSNTTTTATFDHYTKKNNNSRCIYSQTGGSVNPESSASYKSISIVALAGSSTNGLLRTAESLELINNGLLEAQNVGSVFSKFKTTKTSWKPYLTLPALNGSVPGRYFLTAAAVGTSLYAIGGSNGLTANAGMLIFDGGHSWFQGPPMKVPRIYHTTVNWVQPQWRNMAAPPSQDPNATFFVIAGATDLNHGARWGPNVQSYNPQTWQWVDLPDLQRPLQSPAAGIYYSPYWINTIKNTGVWINDRIVVMGGTNQNGVRPDVETIEIVPTTASQWTRVQNVFSLKSGGNLPPGFITGSCTTNNPGGCQLSNANMFLVKGPPRPGSSESTYLKAGEAITYIVAIPIQSSSEAPYLYDIPLHCINKPKDSINGWRRSKQPITCNPAKPAPWATTYSIVENITKYFYGKAKPIGKYIKLSSGNFVWCDDYAAVGQHNYIFIAGGSTNGNPSFNSAALNTCGILDIKITNNNLTTSRGGQSVFTATYTQGPLMMYPRFGAGGAVMAK